MKFYYTDKKLTELLNHMVILCDTKEKSNAHILSYFDKHKIPYKSKSLKTGDYGFMISECPELGFLMDTYFTDELCIERKASLDELAGNMVDKTDRFLKELNRMINIQNVYLLIENNRIDDVMSHNYQSKYNELSYLRSLLTMQKRSNIYLDFVRPENMGQLIYEICRSCLIDKILK